MEKIEQILRNKKETAEMYAKEFDDSKITFVRECPNSKANYWLNCA